MPQYEIRYERTHLFAPAINIAMSLDIQGDVARAQLESAVGAAVRANGILSCKIALWDNGEAFYESLETPVYSIAATQDSFEEIIARENRAAFDLEHGELVRFYIRKIPGGATLTVIAHHLAGDGLSIAFLIDGILRSLSGEDLEFKPISLLTAEEMPKDSELGGSLQFMLRTLNQKWRNSGRVFNFTDFRRMFEKYWEGRESEIFIHSIEKAQTDALLSAARRHGVTLNTVLTTAILQAADFPGAWKRQINPLFGRMFSSGPVDAGMAASIRRDGYAGMGNFATGISILYGYDGGMDFFDNAIAVHRRIYEKLDSEAKKYFLLQFIGSMEPTLIDSAYFSAFDGYKDSSAKTVAKMFGYAGRPKGVSITNLGQLPLAASYGSFAVRSFRFVAPLVPNARRIFGVATHDGALTLTLQVPKDEKLAEEKAFFEQTVRCFLAACDPGFA